MKYSLSEIKQTELSALSDLIEEYYEPEFARETRTDARQSILKTRMLIEGWRK